MRISVLNLLFFEVLASAAVAWGQRPAVPSSHIDLSLTYSADRTNITAGSSFWLQGGSVELVGVMPHGFAVVANVSGLHAGSISPTQVPLSLVVTTFGPRYTWRMPLHSRQRSLSLFGQGLAGEAHGFDSIFPSPRGADTSASSLALQVGGGADLGLSRHLALRLVQIDWLRMQFPNGGTNVQNHLLANAGVVFHF